jgi:hypothetical protein
MMRTLPTDPDFLKVCVEYQAASTTRAHLLRDLYRAAGLEPPREAWEL